MHVVDDRDDRAILAEADQHPVEPVGGRGERRGLSRRRAGAEHGPRELAGALEERLAPVAIELGEGRVEELPDESPRKIALDRPAARVQDPRPAGAGERRRLAQKPGLADPRRAGDEQHRPLPRARGRHRLAHDGKLALSLEQGSEIASCAHGPSLAQSPGAVTYGLISSVLAAAS